MRKGLFLVLIFLLLLVAPSAIRYLNFYNLGGGSQTAPPIYQPQDIPSVPTPGANTFVDEPEMGEGLVLLDMAHGNDFRMEEIGYLDGRLAKRGFELVPYNGGDLAGELRAVNAFIVIAPQNTFADNEILAISRFVDRGGRLLLVGDPTRFTITVEEDLFTFTVDVATDDIPLNSLANEFNLIFRGDYLYNTVKNEGNFRNIILDEGAFAEHPLTENLEQLAFYGSHSLLVGPGAEAILTADDQTWSSATDRPGDLILAAAGSSDRVLALGDINFLTEPYATVYDNGQFIAQIADFLTEPGTRGFILPDFPYFYRDAVDLIYTGSPELGPDIFTDIIDLQEAFSNVGRELRLTAEAESDRDALYLGLYNQSEDVADLLEEAGITLVIEPPILTQDELEAMQEEETEADEDKEEREDTAEDPDAADESDEETPETDEERRLILSDAGAIQMSGAALVLLQEEDGQRNVVVLAASKEGLQTISERMLEIIPMNADYALNGCVIQDNTVAFCPTFVANEPVEAELISGSITEDEPDADSGPAEVPDFIESLGATYQGPIGLNETVSGSFAEGESHAWVFAEGPATLDILLEGLDDLDTVIELYDPEGNLITSADNNFDGNPEELTGVDIPDGDSYTIIVRAFLYAAGDYSLTVSGEATEGSEEESESSDVPAIFIFADDDGNPIGEGFTDADVFSDLLSANYDITVWTSTLDGPLTDTTLEGYDLVIWDSGDYQNPDGFLDDDANIILEYVDAGEGGLFIVGASPTLLGDAELGPISDLEVVTTDPVITQGFTEGEIIPLDQTFDAVISDLTLDDLVDGETAFFLRGPDSNAAGNLAGLATTTLSLSDQKTALFLAPYTTLPDDIEALLMNNLINWFELNSN